MKNINPHYLALPIAHSVQTGLPLLFSEVFFMEEVWKEIEGFPCYKISNLGRIKSLKWNKEKILTAHYIGSAVYYKRSEINRLLLDKDEINFNGFDLLSTPISKCLSSRVSNILEPNVSTVNELIKKEEAELIKYRCMGKISLEEIKGFLKSKGLKLGMSNDEVFKFIETH